MQDDKGQLYLDWRTRAEVDQKKLIDMLLSRGEAEGRSHRTTRPRRG